MPELYVRGYFDPYVAPYAGAPGAGIVCGKGVTKQADADSCDINKIYARYLKDGQLPPNVRSPGTYGDYSSVPDYQESLEIVRSAEKQFLLLPVELRNRFENDPVKFLEFATNPANKREMAKLGLLNDAAVKQLQDEDLAISLQVKNDLEAKNKPAKQADSIST